MFGCLRGFGQAGSAAITVQPHLAAEIRRHGHESVGGRKIAIVEAVREAYEVRRVPVAAYMCRLPHGVAEPVVQRPDERPADAGAASVVPTVRTHQEQFLAEGGAEARALSSGDRLKVEFAKFRRIG